MSEFYGKELERLAMDGFGYDVWGGSMIFCLKLVGRDNFEKLEFRSMGLGWKSKYKCACNKIW